ncbi:MAG: glycine cleavage T C-terminal barrel domain-containing protein [Candidatus Nanopelagicales bacterium]
MSYTSPLLALPGACPAPEGSSDDGVAWHYGDPHGEQRRLEAGEGWVDLSHRGVVAVTGPDRLSWLHSLTTQHVEELPVGGSALDLVLSPHGHVEHELHLVDDGTTTWITVEPGTTDDLVGYLDRMRFMLRVEVADRSGDVAVVAEPVGEPHPSYPTYLVPAVFGRLEADDPASQRYVPRRPGVLVGREVLVPRAELPAYVESRPGAGTWAWEALRVAAGVPRLGHETDHRTIPQEVGWVPSAVHLAKGCYRGQETVARVHNLGRPPRRLVQLHLDGSAERTPAPGDPVRYAGRDVGVVTSVALHHELGPVALAVVKRSVPLDVDLVVGTPEAGEVAAAQETVVIA